MILKNLLDLCVFTGQVCQTYLCLTIPLSGNSIFQEIKINVTCICTLKHSTNSKLCMCILVLLNQIYMLELKRIIKLNLNF